MKICIFTNKGLATAYAALIHTWLTKNCPRYNADRWCNIDDCVDQTGTKWYVKVPPDYEVLNAGIQKAQDRLEVHPSATVVEALPIDWRAVEIETGDLFAKGLGLFNYSKPVTNFRGQKVSRWSLFKDLLKEIWRRIKNLFKCNTK